MGGSELRWVEPSLFALGGQLNAVGMAEPKPDKGKYGRLMEREIGLSRMVEAEPQGNDNISC